MIAVKLGQSQFNSDPAYDQTVSGPDGTVTVFDPGPQFMSGMFCVRGMGSKIYVQSLDEAIHIARGLVGLGALR